MKHFLYVIMFSLMASVSNPSLYASHKPVAEISPDKVIEAWIARVSKLSDHASYEPTVEDISAWIENQKKIDSPRCDEDSNEIEANHDQLAIRLQSLEKDAFIRKFSNTQYKENLESIYQDANERIKTSSSILSIMEKAINCRDAEKVKIILKCRPKRKGLVALRVQNCAMTAVKFINLMESEGMTKEDIFILIDHITPEELNDLFKIFTQKELDDSFTSIYQTPNFIEAILIELPIKLEGTKKVLSLTDLLEIAKKLWLKNPLKASQIKGPPPVKNNTGDDNLDYAPLIHRVVHKYIICLRNAMSYTDKDKISIEKYANILKEFIEFIVEKSPETLCVKNKLGNTILHMLQSETIDSNDTTKELIKKFIEANELLVNAQNEEGQTALHYAIIHNKGSSYVQTLLENGADPSLKDKKDKTSHDYVKALTDEATRNTLVSLLSSCQTKPTLPHLPQSEPSSTLLPPSSPTPNTENDVAVTNIPMIIGCATAAVLVVVGATLLAKKLSSHGEKNQHKRDTRK